MKLIPFIFWFLLSCAGHQYGNVMDFDYDPQVLKLVPDTTGVMALIGYNGQGHACPVEGKVYSARHLLETRTPIGTSMLDHFMWADGRGGVGWGKAVFVDKYQDIGLFAVQAGEPEYYEEGPMPAVGDPVWWVNYKEKGSEAFQDDPDESVIIYMRAGYVLFKDAPRPGSSGSCLLNLAGEAIGVVVWRIRQGGEECGVAVLLPDQK